MPWSDADLPAVQAFYNRDHFERKTSGPTELRNVRGAVQSFMERFLEGERTEEVQTFVYALIDSLYRTGTAKTGPCQQKRRADAMLRATGLSGYAPSRIDDEAAHVDMAAAWEDLPGGASVSRAQALHEVLAQRKCAGKNVDDGVNGVANDLRKFNKSRQYPIPDDNKG